MNFRQAVDWKVFWVLWIACVLSTMLVFPYALTIQGDTLSSLPISLPVALILSIIQGGVFYAIVIFVGLRAAKSVGLRLPLLESWSKKQRVKGRSKQYSREAVVRGVLVGVLIIFGDMLFTYGGVQLGQDLHIPVRQGFLASFYGGIVEEVLMRLFLLTSLVRIVGTLTKSRETILKNNSVMRSIIIIVALMFGVGHLPAVAALSNLTLLVVIRTLVLNAIGGVVFGWLYRKEGLEYGMIAHFSTDIVLHVLFQLVLLSIV